MKANYYYKDSGRPVAHIAITFSITHEHIEKEIWFQNAIDMIRLDKINDWTRASIEKKVRDRFEWYGAAAYDNSYFESFDQDAKHIRQAVENIARAKFPEFYEYHKV